MLAGLEKPTSGQILIDGKDATNLDAGKRDVAMVFQNYALYPTMSVKGNIDFGLKNIKVPKEEREQLVSSVSEQVGLMNYLDRKVSDLSGGQRQRVALARAMVKKPAIFLMDEPLSNLDAKLRVQMRTRLIEIHQQLGATFVYVTHDQVEAMAMATEVVLMNKGNIMQKGTPESLYMLPENRFSAEFIGSPSMNTIESNDKTHSIGFRPERIQLYKADDSRTNNLDYLEGTIKTREMLGSETIYRVQTTHGNFHIKIPDASFKVGEAVRLIIELNDIFVFDENGDTSLLTDQEKQNVIKNIF